MKIYGPVSSWRLGNSLGVDLVKAPEGYNKICSYNCIYCQLGNKCRMTNHPEKIPIPNDEIDILKKRIVSTKPDYITFSGQGEPTLNLNLGSIAGKIKKLTDIPIAVLTNASVLDNPAVREGIDRCNLVIAKIDAPSQRLFERINRPKSGRINRIIQNIKKIRANVAIQTLLFESDGLTNADESTINGLIKVYNEINSVKPIRIFLGTANRPGDNNCMPLSTVKVKKIAQRINSQTGIKVRYYMQARPKDVLSKPSQEQLFTEIINLLSRRPCTLEELTTRFGDVKRIVTSLVRQGILKKIKKNKQTFFVEVQK